MAQQRPSSEPPLSDRLLRSWLRCRRKGWLDRHGNSADRQWNPHRALQLADREIRLQALVSLPLEKATGMEALQAGAPEVRLLLLRRGSLRGRPTLLLRTSESSLLGGFSYQPALLQPGRHGTREHSSDWKWSFVARRRRRRPARLLPHSKGRGLRVQSEVQARSKRRLRRRSDHVEIDASRGAARSEHRTCAHKRWSGCHRHVVVALCSCGHGWLLVVEAGCCFYVVVVNGKRG